LAGLLKKYLRQPMFYLKNAGIILHILLDTNTTFFENDAIRRKPYESHIIIEIIDS